MPSEYDRLLELMRARRSVRRFRDEPLPQEMLEQVLEAARWAPSAANRQAFRLCVVTEGSTKEAMARAVERACETIVQRAAVDLAPQLGAYTSSFLHFAAAPAVIVPIFRRGLDLLAPGGQPSSLEAGVPRPIIDALSSVSAAVMNLLLAAHALGLGACWMTGPLVAAMELRELLGVPESWEIAALVPVGRPAEVPRAPSRKPLGTLVRRL